MRYLFLLGVLPTTFGSLYSLGYTPLQIMVIGAYIGKSIFEVKILPLDGNDLKVS